MARTFADLIRQVSLNVGDLYDGTLTSVTSATTFADSVRTEGDGWWTGSNLSLVTAASAQNAGVERPITNWTQAGGVFTTNAFPTPPSVGDKYEIRRRPRHTRDAIKSFINAAVREIDRQCWVPIDSYDDLGSTLTYKYGQAMYPVPVSLEMVHRVMFQDIDDPWGNKPWYELDQQKWTSNVDGNILIQQLDDYPDWDRSNITIPDGAPLRFMGSRRPAEMVNETDTFDAEGNYVEVYATARMCLRLASGGQDETDFHAKFKEWYALEPDAFRSTRRGLPSGSRKVR